MWDTFPLSTGFSNHCGSVLTPRYPRELQKQRLNTMNNSGRIFNSYEDVELAIWQYMFNNSINQPDLTSNLQITLIVVFISVILVFLICLAGIAWNGIVIWLLSFRMKRSPITTYVLNLAVADIGVLLCSILGLIVVIPVLSSGTIFLWGFWIYDSVWAFLYITDQLLLSVISIDRCVAVLFPLWHRCHQPPHLSRMVCASMWVLSLLIIALDLLLTFANEFILLRMIVNVAICTPIMATSTIILFVKICTKPQQFKRGKLLLVVSLALFFFLIFGFPVNYYYIAIYYHLSGSLDETSLFSSILDYFAFNSTAFLIHLIIISSSATFVCTVLNCSINPLIYFLVGRKKKGRHRQSMKVALQLIFKDEGQCRGQRQHRSETQF
ncbi:proto-oncogene Mas-like isoform X2 [Paroedura picta]|uniref:proto-oncogene Mas-like isoform X2 n=1 Tax=Paroedura picta TaxID=143630 RepID=UPI004056E872